MKGRDDGKRYMKQDRLIYIYICCFVVDDDTEGYNVGHVAAAVDRTV